MSPDNKKLKFGIVSAVGSKHLTGATPSTRKFIQSYFYPQEMQWKDKEKTFLVSLPKDDYLKLELFFKNFPTTEYYFFTSDEKTHFTFRKMEMDAEKSNVNFQINKIEKLVYPEVEQV